MYGEITIELKKCDQRIIVDALALSFTSIALQTVLKNSTVYKNTFFLHANFFFGYQNADSLFLIYREHNNLIAHVECTQNTRDLGLLSHRINEFHAQLKECLKRCGIRKSKALVNIDQTNLTGEIPGRLSDFWTEIKKQKYRLFLMPLSVVFFAYLILWLNVDPEKANNNVKISLMNAAGAYIGVILWFLFEFIFAKKPKEFDFKFLR